MESYLCGFYINPAKYSAILAVTDAIVPRSSHGHRFSVYAELAALGFVLPIEINADLFFH